jgi:hypothetical protein
LAIEPEMARPDRYRVVSSADLPIHSASDQNADRLTGNDDDLSVLVTMLLPQSRTSLGTDESPPNVGLETGIKVLPRSLESGLLVRPPCVTDDPADGTQIVVHLLDDLVHLLLVRSVGLIGFGSDIVVFGNLVGYLRSVRRGVVDDGL